ncbi:LOW QUALITY PROTEIN: hypothetical protein YC2023_100536 [Brassica napus]
MERRSTPSSLSPISWVSPKSTQSNIERIGHRRDGTRVAHRNRHARRRAINWLSPNGLDSNDERRGNRYTVHLFLDGEYHVMDEVAHVCNDYWPTARQLWKPAVVVVELGVTDCKYPLYRWISYTCNKSIQLSSCTAPRLGNPSRGRNDLIDVHLSNQELKDVHPAVEGNPSRGRNDLIDVHLSNQELKDVHPAVEANPSLRRNDLIDVHLSNQELKDVHPAVETNDSVCPSPPRDRLAAYSVGAVKRNGGCIFFAQGHCPFGIDCWFSHLGGERSCIGEASTSRLGRCFSNELGLPGISPPPGNEHEPPWNNHERAAVVRNSVCGTDNQSLHPDLANPSIGRNSLIDVHLSNQDLKDVHHVVEGNPSRGRNDLIDVHMSNQELKDVHPAVEENPSLRRNDLIDVHLSNQELKDVHPAVEANPSLGRNDCTDVHLSSEDLKDVHPAVEANPSLGRNDLIDVHLSNEDLKDVHPAVEVHSR